MKPVHSVNLFAPAPTYLLESVSKEPVNDSRDTIAQATRDKWILVRCQLGERPAFDELIQTWNEPLRMYVRRMAGADDLSNDILQECWLRILRGIPRLRDGAKLRPWMFGIARHVLMDHLRQKYAAPEPGGVDTAEAVDDASTALEEDLAAMEHGLAQLPVVERDVLTLFYLRELSLADVAQVLEVPIGTAKSRLHRARRMLRQQLESKGIQP